MKRLSYEPAKTIMTVSGIFTLIVGLPSYVGIVAVKPGVVVFRYWLDRGMLMFFVGALIYSIAAICYNAAQRRKG